MFDMHVHGAPDIVTRRATDNEVADWYSDAGFSGCVLKAHYESTVGRAAAVTTRRLTVYGGQVLNAHAGGVNPAAVAAALEMGGRIIWLPTADAHGASIAAVRRLCDSSAVLAAETYALPPVDWSVASSVKRVLSLISEADAVLATGHISTAEAYWVVEMALRVGVRRILLTHPSYTVPAMPVQDIVNLASAGCFVEITAFQLLEQYKGDSAPLVELIRAIGYDRIVLASDMGQPRNPTGPEAMFQLVDTLALAGLDRKALVSCASEIPEQLVRP